MNRPQDLISAIDDADLLELYKKHPAAFSQLHESGAEQPAVLELIENVQSEAEGAAQAAALQPPISIDPELPELVLLHGITDCHLADTAEGDRDRIWLDLFELVKGKFTGHLTLQTDGTSDPPDARMVTDGYLAKKYQPALDQWRGNHFRTHVFQYDWRRSVSSAAHQFAGFLDTLETISAGRKVVIACHSMGGLVAATYAATHDEWQSKIDHCIFIGGPLGGSYSPATSILGMADSLRRMARLSIWESRGDFQRMVASFPGLIDMLPNPDVFPEAEEFYHQAAWRKKARPKQEWLDQSRSLKQTLWNSPIFQNATHLVSQGRETVAELPWTDDSHKKREEVISFEGDGAVLTRSSLAPGLSAFKVDGDHGMLLAEEEVYSAVMQIAKGETPNLPPISTADLTGETAAGLAYPGGLLPEPDEQLPKQQATDLATALAPHFASSASIEANLSIESQNDLNWFDRSALHADAFSWQNALSMAIASKIAYRNEEDDVKHLATHGWGFTGCELFDIDHTQGFVCWDDEIVVLSYRGTEQKLGDWLRNLELDSIKIDAYGRVHEGFYKAFTCARSVVEEILNSQAGASQKRLWLTGHSLGASVATIAGAEFLEQYPIAGFYTYGQPKTGRGDLRDFYAANFSGKCHRFVNDDDIVARLPPTYRHVGKLYHFDSDGQLRTDAAGLVSPQDGESPDELSTEEFASLQQQLNTIYEPAESDALWLPPTDMQAQALIPGMSVKDHSIANGYIPVIQAQL